MKRYKFYKHPNCISTCFQVLRCFYIKEKNAYSMKIIWYKWSPTVGICYSLGLTERVKWSAEKCKEWELVNDKRIGVFI